jgi:hypothetical protein
MQVANTLWTTLNNDYWVLIEDDHIHVEYIRVEIIDVSREPMLIFGGLQ